MEICENGAQESQGNSNVSKFVEVWKLQPSPAPFISESVPTDPQPSLTPYGQVLNVCHPSISLPSLVATNATSVK